MDTKTSWLYVLNFPNCFISDTTTELERHEKPYLIEKKERPMTINARFMWKRFKVLEEEGLNLRVSYEPQEGKADSGEALQEILQRWNLTQVKVQPSGGWEGDVVPVMWLEEVRLQPLELAHPRVIRCFPKSKVPKQKPTVHGSSGL